MSQESAMLDELMTRYQGFSDEKKAEMDALIGERSDNRLWFPTVGPQLDAVNCKADILLFGGSGGCGKTDLICGLAMEHHKRSLVIRKHYTDLNAITDRAKAINGTEKGYNGSIPPRLKTVRHAADKPHFIDFGGLAKSTDHEHWQGQAHDLLCVGKGTPVLMGDGTYCAIDKLVVGDLVATLDGPRKVTKVFPVQRKESVRVSVGGISQIQSLSHGLLTNFGWVDHDTSYEFHPCETSEPTQSLVFRRVSESFARPCVLLFGSLLALVGRWRHSVSQWPVLQGLVQSFAQVICACTAPAGLGSDCEVSDAPYRSESRYPGLSGFLGISQYQAAVIGDHQSVAGLISSSDRSGAHSLSSLEDSTDRYLADSHLCGEQPLGSSGLYSLPKNARLRLLRRACVEQPSPTYSEVDAQVQTPTRIFRTEEYVHPYRKDVRQTSEGIVERAFESTPVGIQDLYDIEVDEVNHYITKGGFINKNCIDEVVQNREDQVRFLMGWVRSEDPNQRCRTVFASNPPTSSAGDWIIQMFAPWLDRKYKGKLGPAKPGELRWCVSDEDGQDFWVEGPDAKIPSGNYDDAGQPKYLIPMSRTFIPGTLDDNPFYRDSGYAAQLDALPEPLRSAIRDGNFMAARVDGADQVIPSTWIAAAQNRWTREIPYAIPQCAIGVDGARGNDEAALAIRHDGYFRELITIKGRDIAMGDTKEVHGTDLAALVLKHHRNDAHIIFDVGETTGAQAYGHMKEKGFECTGHLGVDKSIRKTAGEGKKLGFFNKRAEIIWRFREALDPGQDGGSPIMLPDDQMLVSDLTATHWELTPNGIKVTPKKEVVKELGRSPDRGDAVQMAWSAGPKAQNLLPDWRPDQRVGTLADKRRPQVSMGPRRGSRRQR